MNNKPNKLIPELRFPEFVKDGEWKKEKAENLISTITPPKKLHTANYYDFGEFPIIDQSKSFYCGYTNDESAVISTDLPLIIFGDHTCILKFATKPFVQGADGIKIFKTNNKILKEFLYHYLEYDSIKLEDYKRHFSILKEKMIIFSQNPTEQQKIASCLSSLDEVITAQTNKLALLKNHKKGLMQNLFPQDGEKVPKFRFKEFEKDGDWVEKKLGEIGKFSKGKGISKSDIEMNGKYECIRYGQLYTTYGEVINEIVSKTNLSKTELNFSEANDVILPSSGETQVDIARASCIIKDGIAIGGDINIFKSSINGVFLSYYLNSSKKMEIAKLSQGISVVHLYSSQLENLFITYPNPTEQQKIADTLSSLDNLIQQQNEKITQLKLHKKGLMQGLFPEIEK